MIAVRQKAEGRGKSVVDQLADDLQKEYPGMEGFSVSGLLRMHNFYLTMQSQEMMDGRPDISISQLLKHLTKRK